MGYPVIKKVWSYHLLASPPGDATLVSLLRKLTPRSDSDVFSDLHTVHASRILEWLKVLDCFKSPRTYSYFTIPEESRTFYGSCRSLAIHSRTAGSPT